MRRPRIPSWPPTPEAPSLPGLTGRGFRVPLLGVIALVLFATWWSFTPRPDFLLLLAILLAGWCLLWVLIALLLGHRGQAWAPYVGVRPRQRGRDSRVTTLRSKLGDGTARAVVAEVTDARLARRGLSREEPGDADEVRILLGADLLAYLKDETIYPSPNEYDHYLQRIERL